ncbi:hypothetical protein [uncultured Ruminococcus sp.]|uniref:hypothetical protein n=1 Tax=uncultured Ruminococcus sp. TaxID=165186 RepID=UPI0026020AA8|nr:hypothetical protein [uncultured Ruminococcus sp.]
MDRFEKWAEYIMQHGDKILEKKKHRNMLIRRVSFSCASVFAVVIVGFFAWKSIPHKPEFPNDIIIPESTVITTSTFTNNTSIQTTALVTSSRTETDRVSTTNTVKIVTTHVSETNAIKPPSTTATMIQTQPVTGIKTTAQIQTTGVPVTSTVTETQPVNDDSRLLYPIGKQISIERYKTMASASYLIYNDLEASATTPVVTATTQTTATVPSETTTTTVTPDDTQIALEKLTQKENRLFGEFQRERAVLLGELSPDAPRLTLDEAVEIIESSGSFAEICRKLHEAQPLVDYIGGSGITRLEYWFDNKGAQKIYLIMEEESIFYFHFTGADIVYS